MTIISAFFIFRYNDIRQKFHKYIWRYHVRKIMIVEDDKELNNGIAFHIRKAGYEPIQAYILKTAAAMYINSRPDLILLDVGLPD